MIRPNADLSVVSKEELRLDIMKPHSNIRRPDPNIVVGTNLWDEITARNFSELPVPNCRFVCKTDSLCLLNYHAYRPLFGHLNLALKNTYLGIVPNSPNLWHFWNAVSYSTRPWITSFESRIPRWGDAPPGIGVRLLASRQCKKIIAISNWAYASQSRFLEEQCPEFQKRIQPKMLVLHPAQKALFEEWKQKQATMESTISFVVVGRDLLWKGGLDVMVVFDRLIAEGAKIHLFLIGDIRTTYNTHDEVGQMHDLINKNQRWVTYWPVLPNADVLALLKRSQVGIHVSYYDTYGYAVLEEQACGCPVISTDIQALAEINNSEVGWIVHVPKNPYGVSRVSTPEERTAYSVAVQEGLTKALIEILGDPSVVAKKGARAIERIRRQHSPLINGSILEGIYREAIEE